jgi:hypothetical protein
MDFTTILKAIAPTAATLIGGPFAGLALKFLGPALGLSPDAVASTSSAVSAVSDMLTKGELNADQILAIKQAEIALTQHLADNNIKLAELDIEASKVVTADRADARGMQVATKSQLPSVLAVVFVAGFIIVTILKLNGVITAVDQTLNDLITTLRDGLMLILAFYYGSSSGADRATELLSQSPAIEK